MSAIHFLAALIPLEAESAAAGSFNDAQRFTRLRRIRRATSNRFDKEAYTLRSAVDNTVLAIERRDDGYIQSAQLYEHRANIDLKSFGV